MNESQVHDTEWKTVSKGYVYSMIPFTWHAGKDKTIVMGKRWVVVKGWVWLKGGEWGSFVG